MKIPVNKTLRILDQTILILTFIIFIILVGCLSILPIAKSKSYYIKETNKNNVEAILEEYTFNGIKHQHYDKASNTYQSCYWPKYDVTKQDIEKAIDKIIDYLYHSDVTSMQFQILTNDGEVDFFSNQAIEHMKDVKVLFIGGIRLCYLCIVLFVLCVIYLIFRRKYIANSFLKTYLITVGIFILFGLLISLFAISNFDLAFEIFHFIIFPDNSKAYLALSFHACDTLTNVLTSEFFMHIGIIIGITFIGILFLSVVICILLHKYGNLIQTKLFQKENKKD